MVNYKRVVCEVAVLAVLLAVAAAAPARDCKEDHFDQRQNGTENYRVSIDDVVIAVAPAESLLAAASDIDIDISDIFNEIQKPKPPPESSPLKPEESKPDVSKPQESKPETPEKPQPLSEVTLNPETKGHKKSTESRWKNILFLLKRALTHEKRAQSHEKRGHSHKE